MPTLDANPNPNPEGGIGGSSIWTSDRTSSRRLLTTALTLTQILTLALALALTITIDVSVT